MLRGIKHFDLVFLCTLFSGCGGNPLFTPDNKTQPNECPDLVGTHYERFETNATEHSGIIEFLDGDIVFVADSKLHDGGWLSSNCSNGVFTIEVPNAPHLIWSDDAYTTLKIAKPSNKDNFLVYDLITNF